jgi:hypothetical protein
MQLSYGAVSLNFVQAADRWIASKTIRDRKIEYTDGIQISPGLAVLARGHFTVNHFVSR